MSLGNKFELDWSDVLSIVSADCVDCWVTVSYGHIWTNPAPDAATSTALPGLHSILRSEGLSHCLLFAEVGCEGVVLGAPSSTLSYPESYNI